MKVYEIEKFGIEGLARVEREIPEPASNEVLVNLKAASLNFRDCMVVNGTYNPRMKLPAVPFSDAAGEVVATGRSATKWKIGDRVMPIFAQRWYEGDSSEENRRTALGAGPHWNGVLREFAAFSEDAVVRVPAHLSYAEAATLPCAAVTAWNALVVSGKLKAGDTVLTLGTGGVSIFAVQIAKLFGARVISTSSSDEKIQRLKAIGADETINYRTTEAWDAEVLALTEERGVDHVVEVGGADTLPRSLNAVRVGCHIALIGALSGAGNFNPINVFMKSVRIQGIFTGSRAMFEDLNRAVNESKLKPVIDRVYEFDEVQDALRHMATGAHFGKIVIKY
ncbi:MAG: NAD(P)-dependent alcohol dehydrogenase [Acidobacteriota bacterium]